MKYDAIIVGAGIAGASIAYYLAKCDLNVLVLEQGKIASGASGAAGAFLSPMMGRGALVDLVNRSLLHALDLYKQIAPDLLINNGLLRFPKTREKDAFFLDAKLISLEHYRIGDGIFFKDAGVIDAVEICKRLLAGAKCLEGVKADRPRYENGEWHIGGYSAPILVSAIGAYTRIVPVWWLLLSGVWGERIKIRPKMPIERNYSGDVAISASFPDGSAAIGATHKKTSNWVIDQNAKVWLLEKGISVFSGVKDAEIIEIMGGMRPASNDYFPIAGRLIDAQKTLKLFPKIINGENIEKEKLPAFPNLYIFTGHGGRGFVTAPLTAQTLCDLIVDKKPSPLDSDRFVSRYFRRHFKADQYDPSEIYQPEY